MYLKYKPSKIPTQNVFFYYLKWFKPINLISPIFSLKTLKNHIYFRKITGYRGLLLKNFKNIFLRRNTKPKVILRGKISFVNTWISFFHNLNLKKLKVTVSKKNIYF